MGVAGWPSPGVAALLGCPPGGRDGDGVNMDCRGTD